MIFLTIAISFAHRDLEVQVEELDQLLALEPSAELYLRRAELNGRMERVDEALADLDAAEELGEEVLLQRALTLSEGGRAEDARDLLDEAIAATPHWEAHRARARLRLEAGDADGALEDFDAAVARHVNPDLVLERGRATADPDRRADGYLAALERLGPAVVIELACAEALRDAGRPAEAHALLTELIERSGPQPGWLLLRAEVSEADAAHADREAALALARERFDLKPNDLNQMAVEEAQAALDANPRGCGHVPPSAGWLAPLLLLWRRRCS